MSTEPRGYVTLDIIIVKSGEHTDNADGQIQDRHAADGHDDDGHEHDGHEHDGHEHDGHEDRQRETGRTPSRQRTRSIAEKTPRGTGHPTHKKMNDALGFRFWAADD